MASLWKFSHSAVLNQLRHVLREVKNPSNVNIDLERNHLNYNLSPDRNMHPYSYYLNRKDKLYCYNRSDVKTLAGWVVTKPRNLSHEQQELFFLESYNFLEHRYLIENTILATVHLDETQPHLHYLFIPVAPDLKRNNFKICSTKVLTKQELRDFHPALNSHLKKAGVKINDFNKLSFNANVNSSNTGRREYKFEQLLRERSK